MKDGPFIASVATLIGDPARANILTALMDGRALTASELAGIAGVAMPTASGHLAKLADGALVAVEKQGRHRYYRLHDTDVAEVLEKLMGLAQRSGAVRLRTGPRDQALREARICYDHLAGEEGVSLLLRLIENDLLSEAAMPSLTDKGRAVFSGIGIDVWSLEHKRRPVCLHCLDWSERRHHLGGGLGAAILERSIELGWLKRAAGRALSVTSAGRTAFSTGFMSS